MNQESTFSFTEGYFFIFIDEGVEIKAWFSALTGKEKVFVNGELVASGDTIEIESTNSFNIGSQKYAIKIALDDFWRGQFVCTLTKNGIPCQRQRLFFARNKFVFVGLIFIACSFGAAVATWQYSLPSELFYSLIASIVIVSAFTFTQLKPVFEYIDPS